MTKEQFNSLAQEFGLELPKGFARAVFDQFNEEKSQAIAEAKKEAEASTKELYKEHISKEDADALRTEIATLKDSTAKESRIAKYKSKNINVEDADILTLIESKLKESKDFDKDLDEYVKAHPSFVHAEQKKQEEPKQVEFMANKGGSGEGKEMSAFDKAFYELNPNLR